MSAVPWIVGGVALGAGVLWWRNREAAAAPKPGGSSCGALKAAVGFLAGPGTSVAIPPELCGLVDGVIAKVFEGWDQRDAKNKQLNGEADVAITDTVRGLTVGLGDFNAGGDTKFLRGSVARFKSGCTPVEGSPGWGKCKPGTASMTSGRGFVVTQPPPKLTGLGPIELAKAVQAAALVAARADRFMTGLPGDAASFTTGPAADGSFYVAGKPITCQGGAQLSIVRQDGAVSGFCGTVAPTPIGGIGGGGTGTTTTYEVPDGVPPAGHEWNGTTWVRKRAGT